MCNADENVIRSAEINVRYWHLADIDADSEHVRYWGVKRTSLSVLYDPPMTHSGHSAMCIWLLANSGGR